MTEGGSIKKVIWGSLALVIYISAYVGGPRWGWVDHGACRCAHVLLYDAAQIYLATNFF